MNVLEVLTTLAQQFPANMTPQVLGNVLFAGKQPMDVQLTPTFVLGTMCIAFAALVRKACYRYMGRMFTFELSIRDDHKLITDGPYAMVRHPGYGAMYVHIAGLVLCQLGDGSWWAQYGIYSGVGRGLGLTVMGQLVAFMLAFLARVDLEDRTLESTFKEQWYRWREKTPYKLFPWVY